MRRSRYSAKTGFAKLTTDGCSKGTRADCASPALTPHWRKRHLPHFTQTNSSIRCPFSIEYDCNECAKFPWFVLALWFCYMNFFRLCVAHSKAMLLVDLLLEPKFSEEP